LADAARLDAVIGVVDPLNLHRTLSLEWDAQVKCSDLIYLSKRDLVTEEGIIRALEAIRLRSGRARIVEPHLPLEALLDVWREASPVQRAQTHETHTHPHSDFACQTATSADWVDLDALEDGLADLPEAVFRAKGIVRTGAHGWAAFQAVGGRLQVQPDVARPLHGETRIALFGRGLPPSAAEDLLRRAQSR
jgi:G3E family GTPase